MEKQNNETRGTEDEIIKSFYNLCLMNSTEFNAFSRCFSMERGSDDFLNKVKTARNLIQENKLAAP